MSLAGAACVQNSVCLLLQVVLLGGRTRPWVLIRRQCVVVDIWNGQIQMSRVPIINI